MPVEIPVIFILGSGHCGSTLVDLLLDSHTRITGLGECERTGEMQTCGCGEDFRSCPLWKDFPGGRGADTNVGRGQVKRGIFNYLLARGGFYHARDRNLPVDEVAYTQAAESLFEYVRARSRAEILVDSSKNPNRVALLARSRIVKPIIVHVVRDGRGVMWSHMKKERKGTSSLWLWLASNLKIEILKRCTPVPYVFVTYEELVADPKRVLARILKPVDLHFEESMLAFRQIPHHLVAGNRIRKRGPEIIKEDVAWKATLPLRYRILYLLGVGWMHLYYYGHRR